jgi:hypothetical protein
MLEHWWQRLDANERAEQQMLAFGESGFLLGLKEWCQTHRIPLRTAEIPP